MADKKDSTSSIGDFIASLVSKSDSRGVDDTHSSVVRDKTRGGDLSPEEESRVDKIAKRFGKILKIGAFAEPEARRNVGTGNVKGTEAIKDKVQSVRSAAKAEESSGLASFLKKAGIAAAVIAGLLLAFKDNEAVQKILTKFGDVLGFLSEKFKAFIDMDWDAWNVIALGVGGLVGAALILALTKLVSVLPKAALGIALMAGSLYLINKVLPDFEAISWDTIGKAGAALGGLGVIGTVLGAIGIGKMFKGALGLTLLTGALFALSKVLPLYESIDWDTIEKAGVAIGGLGVIGTVFGMIGLGTLTKGAAGLALLSGALWLLGEKGLKPFTDLSWDTLKIGLATVAGFGVLGGIAGVFAPKLLLGALAIGAIGLALIPFAHAADIAAPAIEKIMGAFSNFYGNILEKMPPIIEEIGILVTGVIDSVSGGVNSLINTLSEGVTRVLDGVKGIIKESGDTIVNIANGVSDSISRFFDKLADTILKLNGVDTTKLKEIGPALADIGSGLAKFGAGGFFENILSGLGSLFGADSPLEKFEKLGAVAPEISKLPDALEELNKFKDLKFELLNVDSTAKSFKDLNSAAWNLKGTMEKLRDSNKPINLLKELVSLGDASLKIESISKSLQTLNEYRDLNILSDLDAAKASAIDKVNASLWNLMGTAKSLQELDLKPIFEKISPDLAKIDSSITNLRSTENINIFKEFTDERTGLINKVNRALANLISTTTNLKNTNLGKLTDSKELNMFGVFGDERLVTSIDQVNRALINLLDTHEKLRTSSKDLEDITGSFIVKTLNTVSDTNIKNLTTDTTEYHNFAKTAMQEQIKRQDVMINLLNQLVMKPTGGTSINTNAPMQQIPNKTFDIRDQFNPYTLLPSNLVTE